MLAQKWHAKPHAWGRRPDRAHHHVPIMVGERGHVRGEERGVGWLYYLTTGKQVGEWLAAREVSVAGSTYAPTTKHRMWARELDVTHADVAHTNDGHTSERAIVPNVYRGVGTPALSPHTRTHPFKRCLH